MGRKYAEGPSLYLSPSFDLDLKFLKIIKSVIKSIKKTANLLIGYRRQL